VLKEIETSLRDLLEDQGIRCTVKTRLKTFDSLFKKGLRRMRETTDPCDGVLQTITDRLGVRIIVPFLHDIARVEEVIRHTFQIGEIERKGDDQNFREFGYKSLHIIVSIPDQFADPKLDVDAFEIQVRTILQDAWSEVEHELVYKEDFSPFDESLKRKLAALNANLTLSDIIFQEIRDHQKKLGRELKKRRDDFLREVDLVAGTGHQWIPQPKSAAGAVSHVEGSIPNAGPPCVENPENTGNLDDLLLSALSAHNTGEYLKAVGIYNRILSNDIGNQIRVLVLMHRGIAWFAEESYAEAEDDFRAALKLDPGNSRANYYLGNLKRAIGDPTEGLEAFKACLEIDPYQVEALFGYAKCSHDLSDADSALEYCHRALRIDPAAEDIVDFINAISDQAGQHS